MLILRQRWAQSLSTQAGRGNDVDREEACFMLVPRR